LGFKVSITVIVVKAKFSTTVSLQEVPSINVTLTDNGNINMAAETGNGDKFETVT